MAQSRTPEKTYHVYRNPTKFCHVGRSEMTPAWVPLEACGAPPGGGVLPSMEPGDEWHSENGVAHLLMSDPRKFTAICLGPKAGVEEEMARLNIPKAHREKHVQWDCKGQMPKLDADGNQIPLMRGGKQVYEGGKALVEMEDWIGCVFEGLHHCIVDVTAEYAGAIKATGQTARMTNVKIQVALTKENERLKTEKEELMAKLAKLEESNAAAMRSQGKSPALPKGAAA